MSEKQKLLAEILKLKMYLVKKVSSHTLRVETQEVLDKLKGYTCGAVCDFVSSSECKKNMDCNNCSGNEYITRFPVGWTPTITRNIEKVFTYDDCKEKCKKPTQDTCLNFLKLEQSGAYLENKCRKIGKNKVVCKPISKETKNGLLAGYDGCNVCSKNNGLYGYFEYEKKWNENIKQWDFVNIKEITNPPRTWFEGSEMDNGNGDHAGAGDKKGYGARESSMGGMDSGMGSRAADYKEDGYSRGMRDTRGARDMGEMTKIQSGNNLKYVSINAASQNAKRQEQQAQLASIKLKLDKMNNDFNILTINSFNFTIFYIYIIYVTLS